MIPTILHTYKNLQIKHTEGETHKERDLDRDKKEEKKSIKIKTKRTRNNITKQNEKECVCWGYNMKK